MTIRVLLVDDNALFRDGVARILEADGRFSVVGHASAGEDGVKAALKLQPDVVLMDLHMPGIGGVEAVRRIRASRPELPIGVFTVFEGDGSVQLALDAGADGYLAKDSSSSEFCDAAEALFEGRTELLRPPPPPPDTGHNGELSMLTPREIEVLRALASGATYPAIAAGLGISPKTLRNHISNLYQKLRIYDRAQAVIVAVRAGLVDVTDSTIAGDLEPANGPGELATNGSGLAGPGKGTPTRPQ
jgi:DNA-binding NarL/FixJ family response regulator